MKKIMTKVRGRNMFLKLIGYEDNLKIDFGSVFVNKQDWCKGSTFFDSYFKRWNNDTGMEFQLKRSEIYIFLEIIHFFEQKMFQNMMDHEQLINVMELSSFLGAIECMSYAFGYMLYMLQPTLSFFDVTKIANSNYFHLFNETDTEVFFQQYVVEKYKILESVPLDFFVMFPFTFVTKLIESDKLTVMGALENNVVVYVSKWISTNVCSEEQIKHLRSLIRVSRLSLQFLLQVLPSIEWLSLVSNQYYILVNCASMQESMNHNELIERDQFPVAWFFDKRQNGGFAEDVIKINVDAILIWYQSEDEDMFPITVTTSVPVYGFYWTFRFFISRTCEMKMNITCTYDNSIEIHQVFSMLVGIRGGSISEEINGHTNVLYTVFQPISPPNMDIEGFKSIFGSFELIYHLHAL